MEIIETVTLNGTLHLTLFVVCFLMGLGIIILSIWKLQDVQAGILGMSFLAVGFLGFVVTAYRSEETLYRAHVTDYSVVQEEGYTIEKKENKETYLLRKLE